MQKKMWLSTKETVRILRKNQTKAEGLLWQALRNRKLERCKFIRQYPITPDKTNLKMNFIADFYCAEKKVIIEIDGDIHMHREEYDKFREDLLLAQGYKIIRFTNTEVENQLESVLTSLKAYILASPLLSNLTQKNQTRLALGSN